jgi:hypothetical protein
VKLSPRLLSAFTSGYAEDWLCSRRVKQDATGMESCDSLPQRDCNRLSRFSPRSQPKFQFIDLPCRAGHLSSTPLKNKTDTDETAADALLIQRRDDEDSGQEKARIHSRGSEGGQ